MPGHVGRPRIENATTKTLSVRITPEILARLEEYCISHKKSKGEAVRIGLLMLFDAAKEKTK